MDQQPNNQQPNGQQPLQQQPPMQQRPAAPQAPQPVMPQAPMTGNQPPQMPVAQKPKKSKNLGALIGGVVGLLVAVFVGLGVSGVLNSGTALGELKTGSYHEGEGYSYSIDYFDDAEYENLSESSLAATTTATDVFKNTEDDSQLAITTVTIEDLGSVAELIGTSLTKDELYNVYLTSVQGKSTLESIVVTTLQLDDVDVEGEIVEWSNDNFSDGVRADITGESNEGTKLTGQAVFTIDDDNRFGYTYVTMATDEVWEENADKWPLIEASLKQN